MAAKHCPGVGPLNLELALAVARERLAASDPRLIAARARVSCDGGEFREATAPRLFTLDFMGLRHTVTFPGGEVREASGTKVPPVREVLILHYLTGASGLPVQNRWIAFRELPDGAIYEGPFHARAVQALVRYFGGAPEKLIPAARALGGAPVDMGDVGAVVPAFPLVPIAVVLWRGDEEFPAAGNILFDGSAPTHMSAEDYVVLASLLVGELKKRA
ncbi:MAG: DUF3786 domain-containing protein [Firmicutes bacterium]|nr:DUF3786 domain-containing protein [Bacillota bacterium]